MTEQEIDKALSRGYDYCRMKADQHWDMAGLARQDGDIEDSKKHTDLAREYQVLCKQLKTR